MVAVFERFFADNNTYEGFPVGDAAGDMFPDHLPRDVQHGGHQYDLTLTDESNTDGSDPTGNGFTITVTPLNPGSQKDDGAFTLNSRGQKTHQDGGGIS